MLEQVGDVLRYVACNETECIEVMYNFIKLFEWDHCRTNLQRKIQVIYEDLANRLMKIMESYESNNSKQYPPPYMPKHTGVCITTIAICKTMEVLKHVRV